MKYNGVILKKFSVDDLAAFRDEVAGAA